MVVLLVVLTVIAAILFELYREIKIRDCIFLKGIKGKIIRIPGKCPKCGYPLVYNLDLVWWLLCQKCGWKAEADSFQP